MAWIYLAESAELVALSKSGLNPSLIANRIDTPKASFLVEWAEANYPWRQSGMTCVPSEAAISPASTSCSGASPAKTSALQEMESVWMESEAAYFSRSFAWPKKSSPLSYSLKMSQPSAPEDWTELSKNLPKSGMTADGRCYPLRMLEPTTNEKDGFSWPTPQAHDSTKGNAQRVGRYGTKHGGRNLNDWVAMWPTPNVPNGGRSPKNGMSRTGMTPDGKKRQVGLENAVKMFPTPHGNCGTGAGLKGTGGPNLQTAIGGKLNPVWVEWLMNYPPGWTGLEDWAMQWFRSKRKRRSKS